IFRMMIGGSQSAVIRLRLSSNFDSLDFGPEFDSTMTVRRNEADAFYQRLFPANESQDLKNIQRQAFAGLLWNKQYYNYDVREWLKGDPACPSPPSDRWKGRNHDWQHVSNETIFSMPDNWEYPWYAAWDLAFHTIPLAMLDAEFAKHQLLLLLREW